MVTWLRGAVAVEHSSATEHRIDTGLISVEFELRTLDFELLLELCVSLQIDQWTPGQVCTWLESVGLKRFNQQFSSSGISGRTLLTLDNKQMKVRGQTFVPSTLVSSVDFGPLNRP